MNARLSSATSLILHVALLATASLITLRSQKVVPPPEAMEIEITDFVDVMPLPEPVALTDSDVNESLTEAPQFTPANAGMPDQAGQPTPRPEPDSPELMPSPQPVMPAQSQPVATPAPKIAAVPVLAPAPVTPAPVSINTPPDPTPATVALAPAAPARPASRLNASALSRSLAGEVGTAPRSRLNSATIGSAIGQAVPKGAAGLTVRQRANLVDMIRSQITPCWNPPVAEENSGHVTVVMRISLDRNGAVTGTPSVSRLTGRTAANAAYANALSGSVRRAVLRCSPLKLPAELYDAWSNVELNFDPKDVS